MTVALALTTALLIGLPAPGALAIEHSSKMAQRPSGTYAQGYRQAYRLGYRDGQNFRRYNAGYNPQAGFGGGSQSNDPDYAQGYRDGYYSGFDAGYYNRVYNDAPPVRPQPLPEPNQDNLSLRCAGSLSNGTGFTVFYTREAGFSRVEFDFGSAGRRETSLTYSGKTDADHGTWTGRLGDSDVRVVHQSPRAPQPNDRVVVQLTDFLGQSVCRPAPNQRSRAMF